MTNEVPNEISKEEFDAQEQADFLAAANGEQVEDHQEPEPKEEPPKEISQEPEQPVFTQADIDRIRMEAAAEAEQRHIKRIRDLSGEVGGLRQKLESMTTAKAAVEDTGADAPTSQQIKEASKSGEKLAALKEDFPEWAEAMEELREEILSKQKPQTPEEIAAAKKAAEESLQTATSTAEELATLRALRQLDKAHPDWEDAVASDGYNQWLAAQPANIQYAANESKDARDAITILNMYKSSDFYKQSMTSSESLTANSRQKNTRLTSAITPTSGGQSVKQQPKTEHEEFLEAFGRR